MRLYKIAKCKAENVRLCSMLADLMHEGRLGQAPGALGKYFSDPRFDPDKGGYIPQEVNPWDAQPIMNILRCGNELVGHYHVPSGHFHANGIMRCQNRLCMFCNTYDSYKRWSRLNWMIESDNLDLSQYELFFLTFTVPNQEDGFRESLDMLRKAMNATLRSACGVVSSTTQSFPWCAGYFGNFEITHKLHGWHPHVHLILAYPKKFNPLFQLDLRGRVKSLKLYDNDSGKLFTTSLLNIKQTFYKYLCDHYSDYVINYDYNQGFSGALERFLQIDFRPVKDPEDAFMEVCKYVVKSVEIRDKEDLWIWIRDGYRLQNGVSSGIFRYRRDWDDDYNAARDLKNSKNKNFVYFGEDAPLRTLTEKDPFPDYLPAGEVVQNMVLHYYKGKYYCISSGGRKFYFDDSPVVLDLARINFLDQHTIKRRKE